MTDFVPSAGQQEAVDMLGRFLDQDEHRVAIITGYAGTGKTTLIKLIAEHFGEPTVLAPTGKAALRVGEATGIYGMTIHRFIYEPREDARTGQPIFTLKSHLDETFAGLEDGVVLVDEASMVPPEVWTDLKVLSKMIGFHIVLMGDLFQLPPVYKSKDGVAFSTLDIETPFKVNLTEVIRQALNSPIILASMLLRSGKPEYEALELLNPVAADSLIESTIAGRARGGATICFTNQRRHSINNLVRHALGYTPDTVVQGEPLLVTQNNYHLNVYNGEVIDFGGWQRSPDEHVIVTDRHSSASLRMRFGVTSYSDMEATLSPEEVTGRSEEAKVGAWVVKKAARFWYRDEYQSEGAPPHLSANYGYALTCHKAQGSEWDEVLLVIDPALKRLRGMEKKRFLYTAITRAKHALNFIYVEE